MPKDELTTPLAGVEPQVVDIDGEVMGTGNATEFVLGKACKQQLQITSAPRQTSLTAESELLRLTSQTECG
jgi:hypothetical protein